MSAHLNQSRLGILPGARAADLDQVIEARVRVWREEFYEQTTPARRKVWLAMVITQGFHLAADLRAAATARFCERRF